MESNWPPLTLLFLVLIMFLLMGLRFFFLSSFLTMTTSATWRSTTPLTSGKNGQPHEPNGTITSLWALEQKSSLINLFDSSLPASSVSSPLHFLPEASLQTSCLTRPNGQMPLILQKVLSFSINKRESFTWIFRSFLFFLHLLQYWYSRQASGSDSYETRSVSSMLHQSMSLSPK